MNRFILFFFLLFVCFISGAQGPFEKIYPSSRDRAMRDLVKLSDGGYMLCGWTNTSDPTECDVLVMRTDINGNELPGWPKTYGKSGQAKVDFAYSMTETTDGNFFVLGYSSSYGGGDIDIYLLKVAPDGSEIFTKTFGGFGFDEGREIIKTTDGNYMIVGSTSTGGNQQAFLMKINNAGDPVWSNPSMKTYGTTSKEFGNALAQNADGTFILTGQTFANDPKGDTYLVKTNSSGDVVWEKTYAETFADEGTGIVVNSDGSCVVCIRDSTAATDINVRVRKFDTMGDAVAGFNKSFGGNSKDTPKCISHAKDGNYYIGAISRSWNWRGNSAPDSPDMWLLKINASNGDTMWSRNFGGVDHDHCERVRTDPAQEAILLCGHQVTQPYVKRPYFLKINNDGKVAELGIGQQNLSALLSWYYSNETSAFIVGMSGVAEKMQLNIVDMSGKQTASAIIYPAEGEKKEVSLDLPAGIYAFKITTQVDHAKGKFVVLPH